MGTVKPNSITSPLDRSAVPDYLIWYQSSIDRHVWSTLEGWEYEYKITIDEDPFASIDENNSNGSSESSFPSFVLLSTLFVMMLRPKRRHT
ncbi:MAG: hypothetical protein IH840_14570 [Candidatus Heimdallarchaeota archaeon]|nr:hypothetical protein [Candidatus Heimdallarchaeota archaeon]